VNIVIDETIFKLQTSGGISTIWRAIVPQLMEALPEFTFDEALPADVFISSYYQPAPVGAKSIVMVYDYLHERYPGLSSFAPDALWKRAAVERADVVMAISQWTADDVKRFSGKSSSVAYPATSLTRATHDAVQAFKAKYNLPDRYVLIVGRRDLYKNVGSYFQALTLLPPNLLTVCIGDGSEPGVTYGRPVRGLRLPAHELAAAYTGAMCLVYPSLYEGFGLPVLEAYACGCAVICGDGGALAEINQAACVVDVTKPREIAEALVKVSDPGARIDHILRGYEVAKRFSWQGMVDKLAAVVKEVTERETVS
jgi:glycosyltransferase involved in cell wall biosynthesis